MRGALLNRKQPDMEYLRSLRDPERYAWAILPHVARSFAASVLFLRYRQARTAMVGYLYTRMVDTFEDMVSDPVQRSTALAWFATRFTAEALSDPGPEIEITAATPRQEVDRLLFERRHLVDRLYLDLPQRDRDAVASLVATVAGSMQSWSEVFANQGGVLESDEQLRRYCDDVIGGPARFAVALVARHPLTTEQSDLVSTVSEMIQLANVTRDIEHDMERGIAYHPALRVYLGEAPARSAATEQIRRAREELLIRALRCVPAYSRLLESLALPRLSSARGSAILMLLFTDRHYRACAVGTGHDPWPGSDSTTVHVLSAVLSIVSRRWAKRVVRRVEGRFLGAARAMEMSLST